VSAQAFDVLLKHLIVILYWSYNVDL